MSEAPAPARRRGIVITLAALGALLVVAIALLIALLVQGNAAAEQHDHERIVAICEGQLADPYGEDLGAMTRCIEDLKAR